MVKKLLIHLGFGINHICLLEYYKNISSFNILIVDQKPPKELSKYVDYVLTSSIKETELILKYVEKNFKNLEFLDVYPVSDLAIPCAVALLKKFSPKYRNIDSILKMADKYKCYEKFFNLGIKYPKDFPIDKAELILSSKNKKFISKPKLSTDSYGIELISISKFNQKKKYLIEKKDELIFQEFIEGKLFNVDIYVMNGIFKILSVNYRLPSKVSPYLSGLTIQSKPNYFLNIEKLEKVISKIINGFSYRDGPLTIDLIKNTNGKYYILEISPFFHKPWLNCLRTNHSPLLNIMINPISNKNFIRSVETDKLLSFEWVIYYKENFNILQIEKALIPISISLCSDYEERLKEGSYSSSEQQISCSLKGLINPSNINQLKSIYKKFKDD
tara:strand:+ start:59563 stop:60723 length:1161 start_codon:yes stop_codon:yes gene_type:complete